MKALPVIGFTADEVQVGKKCSNAVARALSFIKMGHFVQQRLWILAGQRFDS